MKKGGCELPEHDKSASARAYSALLGFGLIAGGLAALSIPVACIVSGCILFGLSTFGAIRSDSRPTRNKRQ